jgi:hypothetical protein
MLGQLSAVWPSAWEEIWLPLFRHSEFGPDLMVDLFREHVDPPKPVKPPLQMTEEELLEFQGKLRRYETAAGDAVAAEAFLHENLFKAPITEERAIRFLERSYSIFEEYEDGNFANLYFNQVEKFLRRFSLRYDLRRPLTLHPTLPGIFASLVRALDQSAAQDLHISQLLSDFKDAIRDLRNDVSQVRVKTCIQRQFNLLEAIGQTFPGVTQRTLGDICGQIDSWPHATIRDALKKLYGFRSDYPGLGHAGNPAGVLRELDARDMVAMAVMLAGFVPYLSSSLDARLVYGE